MSIIERRNATRFDLQLPLTVRWREGAELREARTTSEDVSSQGVYFVLAEGIRSGTKVEMEVTLPTDMTHEERVRVRCSGRILRSSLEGVRPGVAAVIEKYRFVCDRRNLSTPAEVPGV